MAAATSLHPKVKAGGQVAGAVAALVALAAIFGIDIDDSTAQALAVVGAALAPVIAGYVKSAT